MGNLYTQLVKAPNKRLKILTDLKYQFRCNPKDWPEIERLRSELIIEEHKSKQAKKDTSLFPNHASYIKKCGRKPTGVQINEVGTQKSH